MNLLRASAVALVACAFALTGALAQQKAALMQVRRQQLFDANHIIYVDGRTYAYTAAGIQAALNAAGSHTGIRGSIDTGIGGSVILPDTSTFPGGEISLGTGGLIIPAGVTLKCMTRHSCKLGKTGTGFAATLARNTFHAGIEGVVFDFPTPVSGQGCISITGNGAMSQWSQDNVIRDNSCNFATAVRGIFAPTAGTVGISLTGVSGTSDVALNHIEDNVVMNAATPITINFAEQNWLEGNRIEGFIAPAVFLGATAEAIWGTGFRIAGNGSTGHAVSIASGSTRNHLSVWCDSGAADCFNDAGGSNYLEGVGLNGASMSSGTASVYDTFIWNGVSNQTYTWSCTLAGTLVAATNWCGFTLQGPITVTYIEGTAFKAGSGCSRAPTIILTDGSSASSINVAGQTFNSGATVANFNSGKRLQINTTGGTGCTSSWSGVSVTVTYKAQQTP